MRVSGRMDVRGKTLATGFLSGLTESEARAVTDRGYLSLKTIDWAPTEEDVMGSVTVATDASNGRSGRAFVIREAAERTARGGAAMEFGMAETPAVSALARRRDVWADMAMSASNVDRLGEVMPLERDTGDIYGEFPLAARGDGVTLHTDRIILRE